MEDTAATAVSVDAVDGAGNLKNLSSFLFMHKPFFDEVVLKLSYFSSFTIPSGLPK